MLNKFDQLSDEEFIALIKESGSKAEILFKLGYTVVGNSWGYSEINKRWLGSIWKLVIPDEI